MALVSYPDSESEVEEGDQQKAQSSKAELPPLPAAFHDLYSANARTSTSDDPSLHGGRKRAVPHVEGNWPSHVYLEWIPSTTEFESLHTLITSLQGSIERANNERAKPLPVPDIIPSLRSPLGAPLPLHISLSRTLQIKTDDRETFLETLTDKLRGSAVRPFPIRFDKLKWVPNFERNRWFLVLGIEKPPDDALNRLLESCNTAAVHCGHSPLYVGGKGDGPMEQDEAVRSAKRRRTSNGAKGPEHHVDRTDRFHITVAWNLIEPALEWTNLARDMNVSEIVKPPRAPFEVVKVKIGNTVHSIPLNAKRASITQTAGLLGLG